MTKHTHHNAGEPFDAIDHALAVGLDRLGEVDRAAADDGFESRLLDAVTTSPRMRLDTRAVEEEPEAPRLLRLWHAWPVLAAAAALTMAFVLIRPAPTPTAPTTIANAAGATTTQVAFVADDLDVLDTIDSLFDDRLALRTTGDRLENDLADVGSSDLASYASFSTASFSAGAIDDTLELFELLDGDADDRTLEAL